MADTTITSANSVVTLSVAGLFPNPQQLQGFAAERAWESDSIEMAEIQMGVDGRMTAGRIFNPVPQNFSLQADSPSQAIFDAMVSAMESTREIFYISGTIDLPSTGNSYIGTRGVLRNVKKIPDAGRVLQAMTFTIVWQSLTKTLS